MIITLDLAAEQVSVELDATTTVIDFATIAAQGGWTKDKVISMTLDNIDPETALNVTMTCDETAFLRNIINHIAQQRGSEDDYYNDRNIYKLWRLLDGDTDADIEADLQNIESQRMLLEQGKTDHLQAVDVVLAEHLDKMAANTARAAKEKQLNDAQYNYDSVVIILSGYDSGNGFLIGAFAEFLPGDLQDDLNIYIGDQIAVNELVVAAAAKTDDMNRFIALIAWLEQQIANLDPGDPNYAADLAALEAQVVTAEGNRDAASNDLDVINTNLATARATLKVDEVPVFQGLETFRDDQLALVTTYTDELADMPYYEDLGDAPAKAEVAVVNSEEMRRMIFAVSDATKPNINLRNVSPELVYQAYDRRGESINP